MARYWRQALAFLTVVLACATLALAIDMILLIFMGMVFGTFLHFVSSRVADRSGLPRRLVLGGVSAALVVVLVLGAYVLGTRLAAELDNLLDQLPAYVTQLESGIEASRLGGRLLATMDTSLRELLMSGAQQGELVQSGAGMLGRVAGVFSTTLGAVTAFFIVATMALYVAVEPRLYVAGVIALTPARHRERVTALLGKLERVIGWWFVGQTASMAVLGTIMSVGLTLLGVPYALLFGAFTALMTFVPNVGPLIAAVPPLLLSLTQGLPTTGLVLLLILVLQNVEGLLLTPLIHRHNIALPPALVLGLLLVLGTAVGVLGMFVAMPLIAVAITTYQVLAPRAVEEARSLT